MRYQLYSWRDFSLFGRVEYRWSTGWGGAIETEYYPPDTHTLLSPEAMWEPIVWKQLPTNNFVSGSRELIIGEVQTAKRIRLSAGINIATSGCQAISKAKILKSAQPNKLCFGRITRPLLRSQRLKPGRGSIFRIDQAGFTYFLSQYVAPLYRSNRHLSSLWLKASYLDFSYSDKLASTPTLKPPLDYRSGRFEVRERLHRPIYFGRPDPEYWRHWSPLYKQRFPPS